MFMTELSATELLRACHLERSEGSAFHCCAEIRGPHPVRVPHRWRFLSGEGGITSAGSSLASELRQERSRYLTYPLAFSYDNQTDRPVGSRPGAPPA